MVSRTARLADVIQLSAFPQDTQHLRVAKARLEKDWETLDYGVHAKGTNEWDGTIDDSFRAFS